MLDKSHMVPVCLERNISCRSSVFKIRKVSPGQVAQLVGALFHNQNVGGSIPGQGTCLGCEFNPQEESVWEATH